MTLIIVFGGYQLVQSLPASHSASQLHRAEMECSLGFVDVFHFAQTSVAILALAALVFL